MGKNYHDYVIKNGKFIGDFEGLYKNEEDPWHQNDKSWRNDSRRVLAINWCKRLRDDYNVSRVLELGCGFGYLTEDLRMQGFSSVGVDVSEEAIKNARKINPGATYITADLADFSLIKKFDSDIYIMADITWYVLDDLKDFLDNLKSESSRRLSNGGNQIYLIHLLAVYSEGTQKYGTEYFTDLKSILKYFKLDYLESAHISTKRSWDETSQATFFVAKI